MSLTSAASFNPPLKTVSTLLFVPYFLSAMNATTPITAYNANVEQLIPIAPVHGSVLAQLNSVVVGVVCKHAVSDAEQFVVIC